MLPLSPASKTTPSPIGCRSQRRHSQISTFPARHRRCSPISRHSRPRSTMSSTHAAPSRRTARDVACAFSKACQHLQQGETQATALFRLAGRARGPCTNSRRQPLRRGPRQPRPPRRRHQWRRVIRTVGKTPCTCPMARTASRPRGNTPCPAGRGYRCVGRACALSPMTPPSHAAENETMMRRPVRATTPEPTGTCSKPHRPTNPGHARPSSHGPPSRQSGNETFVRRTARWSRWRDRGPGGAWRQPHRPGSAPPTMPATAMRHDCCHQLDHVATCFRISRGSCSRLPSIPVSGRRELANAAQQNPSCVRVTIVAEPGIEPVCQ